MINLNRFIADHVINRQRSMFAEDIEANKETLRTEIENKSVCVVGGAGSIGSSFIKAVLPFRPSKLVVIDLNENGLAELTRDLRSTYGMYVPEEYRTYTLNFADPIFERIFREEKGFDIFANFSAHKHVRSEKDKYSVQALIENNDIKANEYNLLNMMKNLLTFTPNLISGLCEVITPQVPSDRLPEFTSRFQELNKSIQEMSPYETFRKIITDLADFSKKLYLKLPPSQ